MIEYAVMWRVVTVGPACGKATLPLEFREAAALESLLTGAMRWQGAVHRIAKINSKSSSAEVVELNMHALALA